MEKSNEELAKIAAQILARAINKFLASSEGSSSNKPITSKWYQDAQDPYGHHDLAED